NKPLDFNGEHNFLGPICLPPRGLNIRAGAKCVATGWGRTATNGNGSATLRQQLCTGYLLGGKDICQGDSGGPFNCQLGDGTWVAYGIISFTDKRGCGLPFTPTVFTRCNHWYIYLFAYYLHLGANLGVGGHVVTESESGDDCIQCPFHGW
ncbi:unnamed protein product, partial [Medioppia subpectinata]